MGAAFTPPAMQSYVPRVLATCEAHLTEMASQESFNLNEAVRAPGCPCMHPACMRALPCS